MTMKEFLSAVAVLSSATPEMVEFANAELAKIENKNKKRRETVSQNQANNQEMLNIIVETLKSDTTITSAEVAVLFGVTTQKASAILAMGVKTGVLSVADIKNPKGKGKVKGYSLISTE